MAVVRTVGELKRAGWILGSCGRAQASDSSGASRSRRAAYREIARIERAILEADDRAPKEYGDLQAGLKRIVELRQTQPISCSPAAIDGFATWRSSRRPGGWR